MIDNVPPFVKGFATDTFGSNDEPALLMGIPEGTLDSVLADTDLLTLILTLHGVAGAQPPSAGDPVVVGVRTATMLGPLLDLDGLLHGDGVLTIEDVFEHATVDVVGRVLVPMLDLLALARVDAEADVLMLRHADGSSYALRIADVIRRSDVYLQLSALELPGVAGLAWSARLRTHELTPSPTIRAIRAMSFASFVGLS